MKVKTSKQSRFLRIITIPVRALCRARDLYVKGMTSYADRMHCGSVMAVPGASQVVGLPKSFSVNSYNDEDFRQLVRAASARSSGDSRHEMKTRDSGSGMRAMGRIDEDRPCCYFGEDMFNARNELKYPRSKSHALTGRRLTAF